MLQRLFGSASSRIKTEVREGAGWYFLSSLVPPIVSLLLGPLILRKVGLEEYAVLALAGYFFSLVMIYYDFGTFPHLLAIFSKKSPERHTELAHAVALRALLLIIFYGILGLWTMWVSGSRILQGFLAISMLSLALPSPNLDWYLLSSRRYFHFFKMRLISNVVPVVLLVAWFFSPYENILLIAGVNLASALAASIYLSHLIGSERIRAGLAYFKLVSWHGLRSLASRILPLALTQLLAPYFLAYALVWYSMLTPDKELVGAFGISYRVIIGFSALMGPLVLYVISRTRGVVRTVPIAPMFVASLAAVVVFGIMGVLVIWFYFVASGANPNLLSFAIKNFSILMAGIFFICLRTVHVSNCAARGDYRAYFLIHLFACGPIVAFSLLTKDHLSASWVPWLACLPDAFAALGFYFYFFFRHDRRTLVP